MGLFSKLVELLAVRPVCVVASPQEGDEVDRYIKKLTDPYFEARRAAAEALGEIKEPRAVLALCGALKEFSDVWEEAARALVKIGSPAVPQLREALKDEDKFVRWRAGEALGEIKDRWAVEALIGALKDEEEYVRNKAAEALGEIGDKSAITPLKEQLARDGHSWIRSDLIDAIQKLEGN